jgi:hypothetical protein
VHTAYFDDDVQTAFDAAANIGRPEPRGPERNDPTSAFDRVKDADTEPNSDGAQHSPKPANTPEPVGGAPGHTQYRYFNRKPAVLGPKDTTMTCCQTSDGVHPDTIWYDNPK